GSLAFLRTALIRTGIGLLIVATGELVHQLSSLVAATGSWGAAWQRLGVFFESVTYAMQTAFSGFVMSLKGLWSEFIAYFMQTTAAALGAFGVVFDLSEQIKVAETDARQFHEGASVR